MIKLNTIFDYTKTIPEPQYSSLFYENSKKLEFVPLYLRTKRNKISKIRKSIFDIYEIVKSNDDIIVNDMLSHALSFRKMGYKLPTNCNTHDCRKTDTINNLNKITETEIQKILVRGLIDMPKEIEPWMSVKAKSSIVYGELIKRGVMWGPHQKFPIYNTNTLTGRSKSMNFNIQGMTSKDPIRHVDPDRRIFVCFDWVSADMRVAGYLSGDKFLNDSFIDSDPYSELEKILDLEDVTRDDCKLEMLKSIYSVNMDGPLLDIMPNLKKWMANKKEEFFNNKPLKTMLGMEIPGNDIKSAFNGTIQGSIAEAIQSVLVKIANKIGDECILTEIHDSLVVCCSEEQTGNIIKTISKFMLNPLDDIELRFPVKVSVGKKWKSWKEYKVFR